MFLYAVTTVSINMALLVSSHDSNLAGSVGASYAPRRYEPVSFDPFKLDGNSVLLVETSPLGTGVIRPVDDAAENDLSIMLLQALVAAVNPSPHSLRSDGCGLTPSRLDVFEYGAGEYSCFDLETTGATNLPSGLSILGLSWIERSFNSGIGCV